MSAWRESKKSMEEKKMILVNTDYITGKELEMLGLVKGSTIQSKNVGRDITEPEDSGGRRVEGVQ